MSVRDSPPLKGRGLPRRPSSVKAAPDVAPKAATAFSEPVTQSELERPDHLLVRLCTRGRMSERDKMSSTEAPKRAAGSERMGRVVELAKRAGLMVEVIHV